MYYLAHNVSLQRRTVLNTSIPFFVNRLGIVHLRQPRLCVGCCAQPHSSYFSARSSSQISQTIRWPFSDIPTIIRVVRRIFTSFNSCILSYVSAQRRTSS